MKKIAFMFAVAAMAVACGNEAALTAEDSAAVKQALDDSIKAELAQFTAPVLDEAAENQDSAKAAFEEAAKKYTDDTTAVMATYEARLAANLAAALDAKKNAGENADSIKNEEK